MTKRTLRSALAWAVAVTALSTAATAQPVDQAQANAVRKEVEKTGMTPDVIGKLNAEQIHDILIRNAKGDGPQDIFFALFFTVCVTGIVAMVLYHGYRKEKQRQETVRAAIDKGVPIPPELLTPPRPPRSDLRRGVTLIGLGVGVGAMLLLMPGGHHGAPVGLLLICLGLGHLIAWRLERRKNVA